MKTAKFRARRGDALAGLLRRFDPLRHSGELMSFEPVGGEFPIGHDADDGTLTVAELARIRELAETLLERGLVRKRKSLFGPRKRKS